MCFLVSLASRNFHFSAFHCALRSAPTVRLPQPPLCTSSALLLLRNLHRSNVHYKPFIWAKGTSCCASVCLDSRQGKRKAYGRNSLDRRCYTVCPRHIPDGHDPYYGPRISYRRHGGPFGPGTLNPYSPNQPMNFAGHWPGVRNPYRPGLYRR